MFFELFILTIFTSICIFFIFELSIRLFLAGLKLQKTGFKFGDLSNAFGHLKSIQSKNCPFEFSKIRGNEKTVSVLRGTFPAIITADPDLIKLICTNFAGYFHSRMVTF